MCRVVGDDADRVPTDPCECGHDADAEVRSQFQPVGAVDEVGDRVAHGVHAGALFGHHVAKGFVVARPRPDAAVQEIAEVFLCGGHSCGLVGDADVDDTVVGLRFDVADRRRFDAAQAATFDHRGAGHSDVRVFRCDDDVAASQQCRIAGEAVTRRNADEGNESGQRTEEREGHAVHAGDTVRVGVARSSAATFGEEDEGQLHLFGEGEEAVFLDVVDEALGAGKHRVVVRGDGDWLAVEGGGATDEAVGRRVDDEVVGTATLALGGDTKGANLVEGTCVDEVGDVLAGGPLAFCATLFDCGGSCRVGGQSPALDVAGEVRAFGLRRCRVDGGCGRDAAGGEGEEHLAFVDGVADGHGDGGDGPVGFGRDGVFHLHRLEDDDFTTCAHGIAYGHVDRDDGADQR